MTCNKCKRVIGPNEEFCQQDKTGVRLCLECADYHTDVTMCAPSGCSCSRGGNAMYCECRDEIGEPKTKLAADREVGETEPRTEV